MSSYISESAGWEKKIIKIYRSKTCSNICNSIIVLTGNQDVNWVHDVKFACLLLIVNCCFFYAEENAIIWMEALKFGIKNSDDWFMSERVKINANFE